MSMLRTFNVKYTLVDRYKKKPFLKVHPDEKIEFANNSADKMKRAQVFFWKLLLCLVDRFFAQREFVNSNNNSLQYYYTTLLVIQKTHFKRFMLHHKSAAIAVYSKHKSSVTFVVVVVIVGKEKKSKN